MKPISEGTMTLTLSIIIISGLFYIGHLDSIWISVKASENKK
ncbi:hypothetical protein LPICM02_340083 [Pseudolactococcus piscium]|nr:hypothetical protein LPICM02_340083 [Lactococcus piscium]